MLGKEQQAVGANTGSNLTPPSEDNVTRQGPHPLKIFIKMYALERQKK
jgi:hypothetical protein